MQDYSTMRNSILDDVKKDKKLSSEATKLKQKLDDLTATYQDAAIYSKKLGDSIAEIISEKIKAGISEEELIAFAEECLVPVYNMSQATMLDLCEQIQQIYNDKAGLGLKPVKVKIDTNRTSNLLDRFKEATSFDEVAFLTGDNVARSITRGAVTDSIQQNAEFQKESGVNIVLTRTDGGGCCDWCSSVCGIFNSFKDLPEGFWSIHRNCSCVIDYHVGKTNSKIRYKKK